IDAGVGLSVRAGRTAAVCPPAGELTGPAEATGLAASAGPALQTNAAALITATPTTACVRATTVLRPAPLTGVSISSSFDRINCSLRGRSGPKTAAPTQRSRSDRSFEGEKPLVERSPRMDGLLRLGDRR